MQLFNYKQESYKFSCNRYLLSYSIGIQVLDKFPQVMRIRCKPFLSRCKRHKLARVMKKQCNGSKFKLNVRGRLRTHHRLFGNRKSVNRTPSTPTKHQESSTYSDTSPEKLYQGYSPDKFYMCQSPEKLYASPEKPYLGHSPNKSFSDYCSNLFNTSPKHKGISKSQVPQYRPQSKFYQNASAYCSPVKVEMTPNSTKANLAQMTPFPPTNVNHQVILQPSNIGQQFPLQPPNLGQSTPPKQANVPLQYPLNDVQPMANPGHRLPVQPANIIPRMQYQQPHHFGQVTSTHSSGQLHPSSQMPNQVHPFNHANSVKIEPTNLSTNGNAPMSGNQFTSNQHINHQLPLHQNITPAPFQSVVRVSSQFPDLRLTQQTLPNQFLPQPSKTQLAHPNNHLSDNSSITALEDRGDRQSVIVPNHLVPSSTATSSLEFTNPALEPVSTVNPNKPKNNVRKLPVRPHFIPPRHMDSKVSSKNAANSNTTTPNSIPKVVCRRSPPTKNKRKPLEPPDGKIHRGPYQNSVQHALFLRYNTPVPTNTSTSAAPVSSPPPPRIAGPYQAPAPDPPKNDAKSIPQVDGGFDTDTTTATPPLSPVVGVSPSVGYTPIHSYPVVVNGLQTLSSSESSNLNPSPICVPTSGVNIPPMNVGSPTLPERFPSMNGDTVQGRVTQLSTDTSATAKLNPMRVSLSQIPPPITSPTVEPASLSNGVSLPKVISSAVDHLPRGVSVEDNRDDGGFVGKVVSLPATFVALPPHKYVINSTCSSQSSNSSLAIESSRNVCVSVNNSATCSTNRSKTQPSPANCNATPLSYLPGTIGVSGSKFDSRVHTVKTEPGVAIKCEASVNSRTTESTARLSLLNSLKLKLLNDSTNNQTGQMHSNSVQVTKSNVVSIPVIKTEELGTCVAGVKNSTIPPAFAIHNRAPIYPANTVGFSQVPAQQLFSGQYVGQCPPLHNAQRYPSLYPAPYATHPSQLLNNGVQMSNRMAPVPPAYLAGSSLPHNGLQPRCLSSNATQHGVQGVSSLTNNSSATLVHPSIHPGLSTTPMIPNTPISVGYRPPAAPHYIPAQQMAYPFPGYYQQPTSTLPQVNGYNPATNNSIISSSRVDGGCKPNNVGPMDNGKGTDVAGVDGSCGPHYPIKMEPLAPPPDAQPPTSNLEQPGIDQLDHSTNEEVDEDDDDDGNSHSYSTNELLDNSLHEKNRFFLLILVLTKL